MIYLVVFHDGPDEILSAWSTQPLAEAEIQRLLSTKSGPDFYYHQNRLAVTPVTLDVPAEIS